MEAQLYVKLPKVRILQLNAFNNLQRFIIAEGYESGGSCSGWLDFGITGVDLRVQRLH
jgi:hypothetical protein